MKLITYYSISIIIIAFISLKSPPVHSNGISISAQSCEYDDVSMALSNINDGENLLIPSGICDWQGNSLEINKEISITGAGIDVNGTTLIRSEPTSAPLITFNCLSRPLAFTVEQIKFQGRFESSSTIPTPDRGLLSAHGCQDFVISDNEFTGFAATGIDITDFTNNNPRNSGVIANNRFIENFRVGLGYGISVSSGGRNELEIPFGSESFVFIEDNYFAKNRHAVTSNFDAAYVLRHNHIEDNYPNFAAVDTHGQTDPAPNPDPEGIGGRGGTKVIEVYNNTIMQNEEIDFLHNSGGVNNPGFAGIGLRGGAAVIFDNEITNYRKPIVLLVETSQACSELSPPLVDKQPSDVYLWNNNLEDNRGAAVTGLSFGLQGECEHLFREGVEYFFNRPAGYTPYPYPHPLRNLSVGSEDDILDFVPAIISGTKNQ